MNFQDYLLLETEELEEGKVLDIFSRFTDKVKDTWGRIVQELVETNDAKNILIKRMKGHKLTDEEKAAVKEQVVDVIKSLGIGVMFLPPGGGVIVTLLIAAAKRKGINLLPSSFS